MQLEASSLKESVMPVDSVKMRYPKWNPSPDSVAHLFIPSPEIVDSVSILVRQDFSTNSLFRESVTATRWYSHPLPVKLNSERASNI